MMYACPTQSLPRRDITVTSTNDRFRNSLVERLLDPRIEQRIVSTDSLPPRRKDLKREPDFLFIDLPLAKIRIRLSQKDHMKIHVRMLCQHVEEWGSVRRNNFGHHHQAAFHPTHSR